MNPLSKALTLFFCTWPLGATADLVHRYPFDETSGELAEDTAGEADGAIGANVTPGQSGRLGSSFRFPAAANSPSSRVTLPASVVPGVEFTMSAFVRMPNPLANGAQAHIISGNTGAAGRWNLAIVDTDTTAAVDARLLWFHNGGVNAVNFNGFNFNAHLNDWVHVGVTRAADGATTLYLNGVGQSVGTSTGALVSTPVGIGLRPNAAQFQFDGFIDDVRFYNNALGASEMEALAAETADSDNDGLPDPWEILYFDDLDEDGEDDTDGDGFKNSIEFQAGTDPDNPAVFPAGDNDSDLLDDGWEWLNFGSLAKDGSSDTDKDGSIEFEEFSATQSVTITRSPDGTVASVTPVGGSSDPNNASSQPDSDSDSLPDGHEYLHFNSLNEIATGDFDLDTFSNQTEFLAASNPARKAGTPDNVDDITRVAVVGASGIDEYSVNRGVWTFVKQIAPTSGQVAGVTGHPDGHLYATTLETQRRIIRVHPATGSITTLAIRGEGDAATAGWNDSDPQGIEVGPDGMLYFPTAFGPSGGEGVFRLSPDGSGFSRFIARSGGTDPDVWDLNNARDLEWSGNDLFVSARGGFNAVNRPVYRFDATGAFEATVATSLTGPQGLEVDESGLLITSSSTGITGLYLLDLNQAVPIVPSTLGAPGVTGGMDIIDLNGDTYYVSHNSGPGGVGQIIRRNVNGSVTITVNALSAVGNDLATFESDLVGSPYDLWAAGYGLDPGSPQGMASGDADGDGTLNNAEFALDLDPTDGNSRFAISATGSAATGLQLVWPSKEGISFFVKSSTDLSDWSTLEATITGAAAQETATWTAPAVGEGTKFFRIEFTP